MSDCQWLIPAEELEDYQRSGFHSTVMMDKRPGLLSGRAKESAE